MIKSSCDKSFYKGVDYDGMKQEVIRCATKIYIEQMRQKGENEKSFLKQREKIMVNGWKACRDTISTEISQN